MSSINTPAELQALLYQAAPITAHMQVQVVQLQPGLVEVEAPLAPNRNHHGTLFGGSQAAIATICGWALMHQLVQTTAIVVSQSQMKYRQPCTEWLRCVAKVDDAAALAEQLRADLVKRGKARTSLVVQLSGAAGPAACLQAEYVALAGG